MERYKRCPECGNDEHIIKEVFYSTPYRQNRIRVVFRCMKCGWSEEKLFKEGLAEKYEEMKEDGSE